MTMVPATGEEYIGLPLDQIPPEVAAMFIADAGAAYSHLADVENTGRNLKVVKNTIELGSDSLATSKFLSRKGNEHQTTKSNQMVDEPMNQENRPVAPLADSSEVNMSIN